MKISFHIPGLRFAGMLSLLSVFTISAYGQDSIIDSSYLNSHYNQRLAFFKQMPPQKNEIVFLGNSITEGGEWQELIPGKAVLNRGISGDVSFGVFARLDEIVSSKPSKIFIMIGINDLKRGIPSAIILNNYSRIISFIRDKSPKTQVFLQSILPVNKYMLGDSYKKITTEKINELNNGLQQLAEKRKLRYLDVQKIFNDGNGLLKKEFTLDGIHLRSAAYILWVKYLKEVKAL